MIIITRAGEARFVETLNEITDQREGWSVIVFNLSNLLEEYKSDYQVRIAVNLAQDLLQALDGGIYVCSNGDIVVLARDMGAQLGKKLIFQLRYLYMDDPLAYHTDGSENEAFTTGYHLGRQFDEVLRIYSKNMVAAARAAKGLPVAAEEKPARTPGAFNASRMVDIERQLGQADLSKALRRQAVCAFVGAGQPRRVFDEMYVHIPHLREILRADVDFFSNKWLFKYLTQLLDKRVLDQIRRKPSAMLASPLSINVNMETLLTDEFIAFDAALNPAQKVAVVFEVPVVDAFADPTGFIAACQNAQRRGYRVCLDGLTDTSFVQVKPHLLGVDLLKLQWNADFAADVKRNDSLGLKAAVEAAGGKRVILCRCDNAEAVEYGKAMGISLFQGRYLDQLVHPDGQVEN